MDDGRDDKPTRVTSPLEHSERFEIDTDDGRRTLVVLAIDAIGGKDYALLADETDLSGPKDDMGVYVFEYHRDGGERSLADIDDETVEERVYRHFAEMMGLEES